MAEKATEYYKVSAGFTSAQGVAEEGQVVAATDMSGSGAEFEPLTAEEQWAKYGRLLYAPYTPEEGETLPGTTASGPPPPGDSPIGNEEEMDAQREDLPETLVDKPESKTTSRSSKTSAAESPPTTSTSAPRQTQHTRERE